MHRPMHTFKFFFYVNVNTFNIIMLFLNYYRLINHNYYDNSISTSIMVEGTWVDQRIDGNTKFERLMGLNLIFA